MNRKLWIATALLVGLSTPAFADQRSQAKTQVEFAITLAQRGLWKDATQRWQQATVTDPTYGAAWNNLGIGFEQLGRFDEARKAYEKALELEPEQQLLPQQLRSVQRDL